MKVIGIIAEYNPFHNGHLYQINKIKELYSNSIIIVLLNGNFSQRGDVSLIDKWDKTKILLENNVDLIVELPVFYGINSAELFAKGSLEILSNLKIDILVFGTERENLNDFYKIIDIKNSNEYKNLLKTNLKKGYTYAKASFDSIYELSSIKIDKPNDILALLYIEEIVKNNYNIIPLNIKRTNDYHNKTLQRISSASAIRDALKQNININNSVPNISKKYINNIFIDDYFDLLKYKIISSNNLKEYHDINEGIENRIKKYILESNSLEELISKVKTKRYTYNKIKRNLLYILLNIKKDIKVYNYIRPLGFNHKGRSYVKKIKKKINLPIMNNYSKNKEMLDLEFKCDLIYYLKINKFNENRKKEYNKPINI